MTKQLTSTDIYAYWVGCVTSIGTLWGIINSLLIGYDVFHRTNHVLVECIIGEFCLWIFIGFLVGCCFGMLHICLMDTSFSRIISRLFANIDGSRYYIELQNSLDSLTAALEQKSDAEVKARIGQARECIQRAIESRPLI